MSEEKSIGVDIGIIEIFEILWNGKQTIIVLSLIGALAGLAYFNITPKKYRVSVLYYSNIYSIEAAVLCGPEIKCIEKIMSKNLLAEIDGGWRLNRATKELSLLTSQPKTLGQYASDFEKYNQSLTEKAYNEAKTIIDLIANILNLGFVQVDTFGSKYIYANIVANAIDNGSQMFRFEDVDISEDTVSVLIICGISTLLFGGIGAFFILFRQMAQFGTHKNQ